MYHFENFVVTLNEEGATVDKGMEALVGKYCIQSLEKVELS